MRIHYLQHVPFETPSNIFKWAKDRNITINGTHLYKNEPFPDFSSFDLLLIMGGPMGVYDDDKYPFLKKEKIFIENAIRLEKKVLGICLGAQLIAEVLGSKVYKCENKEIGWFPVFKTKEAENSKYFKDFPEHLDVIHWHGDTFDIPAGTKHLFYSEGCKNQAFESDNGNIVGLQFHLELSKESVKTLIKESEGDFKSEGRFVQSPEDILSDDTKFKELEEYLYRFMDSFTKLKSRI